ncbi:MAG TPA: VCBS repeat-containing protein, partial [bacterium]|nr:VCBS repeat-containing protein [bacterium]
MGGAARKTAAVLLALATSIGIAVALTWTETSWQDFSDGQFTSNLYVSHRYGGTVEFVPRFDFNNDGWMDLVCSEGYGSNVYLYFGDTAGFLASRSRDYPVGGGGECDGADLNCDGYADLIHTGWRAQPYATIYWGTASGPDPQNKTNLSVSNSEAVAVADLDNDGYLDIILSSEDGTSYIYWGSGSGYSPSNVTLLHLGTDTGHNWVVADLNKDGYLDLIGCCTNDCTHQPIFYFGPNHTYQLETLDFSPGGSGFDAQGVTVADFNHDGWLDIVYTGHDDITQAWIYWGSASGFSVQNRTVINTAQCFGGSAAYDFNKDGLVDLLFFRGSYYGAYLKPIIYYNTGSSPYFSDAQTSTIGPLTLNSTGGQVADYNKDGNVDIFLNDFESGSAHVLWGPDWNTVTDLPCYSGHHGVTREIGNIYDRTYREDYVSSVFDGGGLPNWHTVSWDDSTPGGSAVEMAVRTGATAAPDSTWSGWYAVAKGDTVPDSLNSRYIQYRAQLKYQNPASLPMLFAV